MVALAGGAEGALTDHGSYGGFEAKVTAVEGNFSTTYDLGPVHLSLGGSREFGAGIEAHGGSGYQDGRFILGGDFGLSWGPGTKIAPSIAVDAEPVLDAVGRAVQWVDGLFK